MLGYPRDIFASLIRARHLIDFADRGRLNGLSGEIISDPFQPADHLGGVVGLAALLADLCLDWNEEAVATDLDLCLDAGWLHLPGFANHTFYLPLRCLNSESQRPGSG